MRWIGLLLTVSLLLASIVAYAQQAGRMYSVGTVKRAGANGRPECLAGLANDLVRLAWTPS